MREFLIGVLGSIYLLLSFVGFCCMCWVWSWWYFVIDNSDKCRLELRENFIYSIVIGLYCLKFYSIIVYLYVFSGIILLIVLCSIVMGLKFKGVIF